MYTPSEGPRTPDSREPTRRDLSRRQADTVSHLLDAALLELRQVGYDLMTVRAVALRAGVAGATAYGYFASKEHLVVELYWRRLRELPPPPSDGGIGAVVHDTARFIAQEPALASACTKALLSGDREVVHLRDRIGRELQERFAGALEGEDPRAVLRLTMLWSGGLLLAGLGYMEYDAIADELGEVAALIAEAR